MYSSVSLLLLNTHVRHDRINKGLTYLVIAIAIGLFTYFFLLPSPISMFRSEGGLLFTLIMAIAFFLLLFQSWRLITTHEKISSLEYGVRYCVAWQSKEKKLALIYVSGIHPRQPFLVELENDMPLPKTFIRSKDGIILA